MKKYVISLIVCFMLLSGCSVSESNSVSDLSDTGNDISAESASDNASGISTESEKESTTNLLRDYPTVYQQKIENVNFDCEVVFDLEATGRGLYTATAQLIKVDYESAFDALYSGVDNYEKYEYNSTNEFGDDVEYAYYTDSNHISGFGYGPISSQLSYNRGELYAYVLSAFTLDFESPDYNADLFSTEEQLGFSSREAAYDDILELFQKIGAGADYKYKAYSLDHETLALEEYHMDMNGNDDTAKYKPSWSEADDCYYFVLRQLYGGIPVYHKYVNYAAEEADTNAPIQILISADGIENLNIERIFEFYNTQEVTELASFDDVASAATKSFNQILGGGTYTFTSAELYYYVDISGTTGEQGIYPVRPCWIFKGTQDATGTDIQVTVDAQTAEEIVP